MTPLPDTSRRVLAALIAACAADDQPVHTADLAARLKMAPRAVQRCLVAMAKPSRGLAAYNGRGRFWPTAAGRAEVARAVMA